ncbi:uncharacterized protein C2845_PM03G21310 [Panicum miliaceum]|uniref:Uncharacterized protein n=1 Tax=Panicum miliaceum TaxID=4540 RepID=A0A3L6T569_PANMI|nr:uncharacterized protein C2845_PM03G21310 [Panicum miliaceum]
MRTNRVFRALGVEALARETSVRCKAAEEKRKAKAVAAADVAVAEERRSAQPTSKLEKCKRSRGQAVGGPPKRSKADALLFGTPQPLNAAGDSDDAGDEEEAGAALAAPPLRSVAPVLAPPKIVAGGVAKCLELEVSEMEAESDEGLAGNIMVDSLAEEGASRPGVASPLNLSPRRSSSGSGESSDASTAPVITKVPSAQRSSGTSARSSSESESCFVSTGDPVAVVAELGASSVKLIGGNVVGALRFESGDRERGFLSEASSSFCFPLMEKRLMATGVPHMLQNAQDLALKSFIAARFAARQLEAEASSGSRIAELEERIAALEKEKLELQDAAAKKDEALAAVQDEASAALTLRDKYSSELAATLVKLEVAEAHAKKMEEKRASIETSSVGTARASPVESTAFGLMFLGCWRSKA